MRRHPFAIAFAATAAILVALGLAAGPVEFLVGTGSAFAFAALTVAALAAVAGPVLLPVAVLVTVAVGATLWVRSGRRRVVVPA